MRQEEAEAFPLATNSTGKYWPSIIMVALNLKFMARLRQLLLHHQVIRASLFVGVGILLSISFSIASVPISLVQLLPIIGATFLMILWKPARMLWFRDATKLYLLATLTIFLISACSGNAGKTNSVTTASGSRAIAHSLGETRIPENPQRIVALDPNNLEALLALGLKPVAAAGFSNDFLFPSYLKDKIEQIELVGTVVQPNIEKIVMYQPDLIVGQAHLIKEIYDKLSQIAPTIATEKNSFYDWKEQIQFLADSLGKPEQAKQLLDNYSQRVEKFKSAMGDRIKQTTVSLVQIYEDSAWVFTGSRTGNSVISDVGFPLPPAQKKLKDPGYGISIGLESLSVLDADAMFLSYFPEKSKTAAKRYLNNQLWSKLEAVKNGKVYEVGGDYWGSGSILAANLVLDDLFKYLTKEGNVTSGNISGDIRPL